MAQIALAGSEMRSGIVLQSVFGTAEADGVDFNTANNGAELNSEHFSLVNDINVRTSPAANGVRFKTVDDVLVDTNEAMPGFSVSVPIARDEYLDLILAAWFQNVVEGDTTPFDKTFTLPVLGAAQQPDFSSDAGFFFTIIERHPTASRSRKIADAICQSLTISAEPSGKLNFTAEMIGRGVIDPTSNPSGTWTRYNSVGFNYASLARQTVDFGGGAQAIALKGAWELALTQIIDGCGQDGGQVENYGLRERGGTFKIPLLDDANTMTAFANAVAGTALIVNLGYGNAIPGTDDGDLDFAFNGILTEDVVREKDGIMSAVLVGELHAADTATSPITIVNANLLDRTW